MGDIPMELVNEVMMTITDPAAMLGPEVIMFSIQCHSVPDFTNKILSEGDFFGIKAKLKLFNKALRKLVW